MKFLLLLLLVVAGCKNTVESHDDIADTIAQQPRSPANETEVAILRSADSMMLALKQHNWKGFARFIHPAMVKVMGGEDNMAYLVKEQMKNVPDSIIRSARVESILKVVNVGDELQCVVEQRMVLQQHGTRITTTTYLVGQSLNGGKSWKFFDASNSGEIKPTDIMPNLSPELVIPERKKEVIQL